MHSILHSERTRILAQERAGGTRQTAARRRFNRALSGGGRPTRYLRMQKVGRDATTYEVTSRDSSAKPSEQITTLIQRDVEKQGKVFRMEAIYGDGSRQIVLMKKFREPNEVAAQRFAFTKLALKGDEARCAQFLPVDFVVTEYESKPSTSGSRVAPSAAAAPTSSATPDRLKATASFMLMPFELKCANPISSFDSIAFPCQLTFHKLLSLAKDCRVVLNGYAFFSILKKVMAALDVLNSDKELFVHGDLHADNVLVRFKRMRRYSSTGDVKIKDEDIAQVVIIDTGLSSVSSKALQVSSSPWSKVCNGGKRPSPSRDIMTLFLHIASLVPLEYKSIHELLQNLVGYIRVYGPNPKYGNTFATLNTCEERIRLQKIVPAAAQARERNPAPPPPPAQPQFGGFGDRTRFGAAVQAQQQAPQQAPQQRKTAWQEGDFVYTTDIEKNRAYIADYKGREIMNPHHVTYADTIPPPKGPFATPKAMYKTLTELEEELRKVSKEGELKRKRCEREKK